MLFRQALVLSSTQIRDRVVSRASGVYNGGEYREDGWVNISGTVPLYWSFSIGLDSLLASFVVSGSPGWAKITLKLCPEVLLHLIELVDLCHDFRAVVQSLYQVVAGIGVIRVGIAHARTGLRRDVTFSIGGKFGFCANAVCWSCVV